MRLNYNDPSVPPRIRLTVAQLLATQGPAIAAQRAVSLGYDFWPLTTETPLTAKLAELEAAGEKALAGLLRGEHDVELTQERIALEYMSCPARRSWAKNTSLEDDRKARAADAEITRKAARDAAVAARAVELRDADDAARLARFAEQATAEYDAAHPAPEPPPADPPPTVNATAPQAPKRAKPALKAVP